MLVSNLGRLCKMVHLFYLFIYLPQNTNNNKIKQNSNTKANKSESGEEAQKKPWGLYNHGANILSNSHASLALEISNNPIKIRVFYSGLI